MNKQRNHFHLFPLLHSNTGIPDNLSVAIYTAKIILYTSTWINTKYTYTHAWYTYTNTWSEHNGFHEDSATAFHVNNVYLPNILFWYTSIAFSISIHVFCICLKACKNCQRNIINLCNQWQVLKETTCRKPMAH